MKTATHERAAILRQYQHSTISRADSAKKAEFQAVKSCFSVCLTHLCSRTFDHNLILNVHVVKRMLSAIFFFYFPIELVMISSMMMMIENCDSDNGEK